MSPLAVSITKSTENWAFWKEQDNLRTRRAMTPLKTVPTSVNLLNLAQEPR